MHATGPKNCTLVIAVDISGYFLHCLVAFKSATM